MSEVVLTQAQWERVVALKGKLKAKNDKVDKVKEKTKNLNKMSKSELIELIKEYLSD